MIRRLCRLALLLVLFAAIAPRTDAAAYDQFSRDQYGPVQYYDGYGPGYGWGNNGYSAYGNGPYGYGSGNAYAYPTTNGYNTNYNPYRTGGYYAPYYNTPYYNTPNYGTSYSSFGIGPFGVSFGNGW